MEVQLIIIKQTFVKLFKSNFDVLQISVDFLGHLLIRNATLLDLLKLSNDSTK